MALTATFRHGKGRAFCMAPDLFKRIPTCADPALKTALRKPVVVALRQPAAQLKAEATCSTTSTQASMRLLFETRMITLQECRPMMTHSGAAKTAP